MLTFPQLSSGAMGQFPLKARVSRRTVTNRGAGGSLVQWVDPSWAFVEWDLRRDDLSASEWEAVEMLFADTEGGLLPFTFLDPMDNLLRWSEDLASAVWVKGSGIQLTAGLADPLGTTRAVRVRNTGATPQRLSQTIAAPADMTYCFSAYLRASAATTARLVRASGVSEEKAAAAGSAWRRFATSGNLGGAGTTMTFSVDLDPGAEVDVFGLQVDAQPAASPYKVTTNGSGVYPDARFGSDELRVTAGSLGLNSATVHIVARLEG
ncbi:MAG: hypothetical protein FJW40_08775 [Acidobacteria bacterium]|nr:hypothetical protein [Acidobacteriota bacterium]